MFQRMDHVAMSVEDMDKTIAFYRDTIGMEKIYDRQFDTRMAKLLGIATARVRIVHLALDGCFLELFHYVDPQGRAPEKNRRQSDFGLTHIGFMVSDFWSTYHYLDRRGVTFLGEPVEFRPGVFVAYFHGAEYEVCEIREVVATPAGRDTS